MTRIIRSDEVWESGTTITLDEDIQVASGVTLLIEPGAIVRGRNHSIQVWGELQAGSAGEAATTISATHFGFGDDYNNSGRLEIDNVTFRGGSFLSTSGYGSFDVQNSRFDSVSGFYIWYPTEDSSFSRNVFNNSDFLSVGTDRDATLRIVNNLFVNQDGVESWASYGGADHTIVRGNSFTGDYSFALSLKDGYSNSAIEAANNYFGDVSPENIPDVILDANDSLTRSGYISTSYRDTPHAFTPIGFGTSRNDDIRGKAQGDVIHGLGGHDHLSGAGGNDRIFAGLGDDFVHGGWGDDIAFGGKGSDSLYGSVGNDRLVGGAGEDFVFGGLDDDFLAGGASSDHLYGGAGDDTLVGGVGYDKLFGGGGGDVLRGGSGQDIVNAGIGDDHVNGGFGNDLLRGGLGQDVLHGGKGTDRIIGGGGEDVFVFMAGDGDDTIVDFSNHDTLRLDSALWAGHSSAMKLATIEDEGLVFDFGQGDTLTILGVTDLDGFSGSLDLSL